MRIQSGSALLWSRTHAPSDRELADRQCAICASFTATGVPLADVCGSLTTDLGSFRAPQSEWACEGCALVRGRSAHPPGRASGWYCNFSHFVDEQRIENASKGEKPRILAWLRGPKRGTWSCAIADTGQKHVVCYAPINLGGRGRVRFEEVEVALPAADDWAIVDDATALLTAGATKEEMGTGDYTARAWTLCGDAVRAFEARWGALRGGAWFALVLWLSQRDEAEVAVRLAAEAASKKTKKKARTSGTGRNQERAVADPVGRDAAGVPEGVPPDATGEGTGALANHPGPDADRGSHQPQCGRVGDVCSASIADPKLGQLDLFAAAGAVEPRARE